MASPRPRSFALDVLVRTLRFMYLLWGGMLLGTTAAFNRFKLPAWVWEWPSFAGFLSRPWGRGLMLGLGLAMAIAALLEVWELVDKLLLHFMHDLDRDH